MKKEKNHLLEQDKILLLTLEDKELLILKNKK